MGNLRATNEVILAKIETTYNTDPVPVAATNAVLVQNLAPKMAGLRMVARPAIRVNLNDLQAVFAGQLLELSFEVEIKGSGTAGTPPEIGPLLRGCALGETIVAVTSVTYKPISTLHESLTIYWYEGGVKLHKITGARGDYSIKIVAGGVPLIAFKFTGHYVLPTDVSIPTPVYNSQVPRAAINSAITIGGTTIVCRDYTINAAHTIALPPSIGAVDGYSQIQITDQKFAGTLTMEAEPVSVIDVDSQLANGTASTFLAGIIGTVSGNKFVISSATNGLYWMSRDFAAGNELRLRTMPFGLQDSAAGNDAFSLAFT
jgi:hypothetical protein